MNTPLGWLYCSPGRVSSQLPPPSAAMSMITAPDFILSTTSAVMSFGDGRPGMAAVVITASASTMWLSTISLALAFSSSVSSRA